MAIETKAYCRDDRLRKDEACAFFSKRVHLGDELDDFSRSESDCIRIAIGTDGSLVLNDQNGSGSVYFYPNQLEHLQTALEMALKRRELAKTKS